jgi:hypothetical protein
VRRYNLIAGILAVGVFLATGQYMDRYLGHLRDMADGPRLLYRTRHIFILAAALVQVSLGLYVRADPLWLRRMFQWAGSLLTTAATGLFVLGFLSEPGRADLRTLYSHWGTYALVAGVATHAVAVLSAILDIGTRRSENVETERQQPQ